jgi:hypothetical protein
MTTAKTNTWAIEKETRQELNQFGLFKFKHNVLRISYFCLQSEACAGKGR